MGGRYIREPRGAVSIKVPSLAEMQREMAEMQTGHDPLGRGREAPGPTRTTSCPYTETAARKPYTPVHDMSVPSLDDGVSFRQKL